MTMQRVDFQPNNGTSLTPSTIIAYGWTTNSGDVICPDLLRLEQIGAADNRRGRVVRLFFRVLDVFMPVRS